MNIVKVKREEINDEMFFTVYLNNTFKKCFNFRSSAPEESIYNEELNKRKAMELAKKLESGEAETEEIIYETPTTENKH